MKNKNREIGDLLLSVMKICLKILFIFILLIFVSLIFIIYRCSSVGNDFSIDENGIIKGKSSPFKTLIIREMGPDWCHYLITIKSDCKPSDIIDITNWSDKYDIVYKTWSQKDSIISNSDFHLKPNQEYEISNNSVLWGHTMASYTFTTDSLCRIDSIFSNTILIYAR